MAFLRPSTAADSYRLQVPRGLDEFVPIPEGNPLTPEKIELGRRLFFDRNLSRDGTVSCASCHVPINLFADRKPVGTGIEGRAGRRNVPSLFNRAYQRSFFWDGRETSLEKQVLMPIQDHQEMDLTLDELEERLNAAGLMVHLGGSAFAPTVDVHVTEPGEPARSLGISGKSAGDDAFQRGDARARSYGNEFLLAFGSAPTAREAGKALASYVRVLLSADSPFDRFQQGDTTALSESAQRGLRLFRGRGNCTSCHSGPLLSDQEFHNTGVSWGREPLDLGRFEVTAKDADRGRFRTPSLRDVALTAPYMHDGSLATLDDVLDFYSRGGNRNPNQDYEIRPLDLTAEEKSDLRAFLNSISGQP